MRLIGDDDSVRMSCDRQIGLAAQPAAQGRAAGRFSSSAPPKLPPATVSAPVHRKPPK